LVVITVKGRIQSLFRRGSDNLAPSTQAFASATYFHLMRYADFLVIRFRKFLVEVIIHTALSRAKRFIRIRSCLKRNSTMCRRREGEAFVRRACLLPFARAVVPRQAEMLQHAQASAR
jgi:hypothetical protein